MECDTCWIMTASMAADYLNHLLFQAEMRLETMDSRYGVSSAIED